MNGDTTQTRSRASILADLGRNLVSRPLARREIEEVAEELGLVEPMDLADAIHALVNEGIDLELLKPAVSRLFNLVSKALARVEFEPEDPFFRSLALENAAFLRELERLRPSVAEILGAGRASSAVLQSMEENLAGLGAIDLHYLRKENILFPYFEARYPRYRCVSLMWSLHDDLRRSLSSLSGILRDAIRDSAPAPTKEMAPLFGRLFFDAYALALREEKVLFPIVSGLLEPREKLALFEESRGIGFCFLSPETIESLAAETAPSPVPEGGGTIEGHGAVILDAGALKPEFVDLVLKSLPLDVTFVDAGDKVAYFSNGPERVFPRSPSIIGRDVRNCHPAKSLDRVVAILEAFKRGERDREDFWFETGGRFVRIEYRAIRDASGGYLGTLEISQDLSSARALVGEKRISESL